jgi:hypothetical protein
MGKMTQFVTFEIELMLLISIITSTILFVSTYFNSTLKIPPIVFMFVYSMCAMAVKTLTMQILVFSTSKKATNMEVASTTLSDVSQGFAVVSFVMWIGMILLMFIDVPRITSIPGHEPAESIPAMGVVIGSTIFIPFLALVVCYTAVPVGGSNTLIFNGSTVGVVSLLFFVLVSLGSGGVTKCEPFRSTFDTFIFIIFVLSYFTLLYVVELLNFKRWNPFACFFSGVEVDSSQTESNGIFSRFKFNFWRIPGAALNGFIVLSTIAFSSSDVHVLIGFMFIVVLGMNAPLIITVKFDLNQKKTIPSAIFGGIREDKGSYEQVPEEVNDATAMQPGIFPQTPQPPQVFSAPSRSSNYFSSDISYGDALRNNAGIQSTNKNHMDTVTRQRRVAGHIL